jgi:hypothetical protein
MIWGRKRGTSIINIGKAKRYIMSSALYYEVYYNRDFPDQTDFPEHVISGMRQTIKQHPERVNCHPIRSIAPLLGLIGALRYLLLESL